MASLEKEDVLRISKERDVKFIRPWFTDILGFLKSFAITLRELEGALEGG
jgi:glutamine synthetase